MSREDGGTDKGAIRPACRQCLAGGGHGAAIASPVDIASGVIALEVAIASGAMALDGDMVFPALMASGAIALDGAIASGAMALAGAIASAAMASPDEGGQAVDAMASAA